MLKDFYTTGEVAKLLGISDRTIKNYCTNGQLGSEKTPITNYRRISKEHLIAFLEQQNLPQSFLN
jgi:excisionase family DNA binding protein